MSILNTIMITTIILLLILLLDFGFRKIHQELSQIFIILKLPLAVISFTEKTFLT